MTSSVHTRSAAAHGEGYTAIIVGADVAAELAADQLCARRQRPAPASRLRTGARAPYRHTGIPGHDGATRQQRRQPLTPRAARTQAEEARRAEREAERQSARARTRFNLELGRAIYTTLSRVRVDDVVLKVLASVEIVTELADVATRGARYGFPGWVTETTQKNGKTKYGYLEKGDAEQRASDYLARAAKPGEIAGRQLALLAMATYANQDAVAISNRSWHHITQRPMGR